MQLMILLLINAQNVEQYNYGIREQKIYIQENFAIIVLQI